MNYAKLALARGRGVPMTPVPITLVRKEEPRAPAPPKPVRIELGALDKLVSRYRLVAEQDHRGEVLVDEPRLSRLVWVAANVTGVSLVSLRSPRRDAHTSKARHIAYWLCRHFTSKSLPQIGVAIGKDHTTVLHGVRKVERAMKAIGWPVGDTPEALAEHLWESTWPR